MPSELHALSPHEYRPYPDGNTPEYWQGPDNKHYDVEDIIDVLEEHPACDGEPLAPYRWTKREADSDIKATEWNLNAFDNTVGSNKHFRIKRPEEGGWGSVEDFKAEAQRVLDTVAGAKRAGRPVVTDDTVEGNEIGTTPTDMDWSGGRKIYREGVLAGVGVPPMIGGVMDQAALNNFKIALLVLYITTIIPLTDLIADHVNEFLVPEFGEDEVYFEFDYSSVIALFSLFLERWEAAMKGIDRGLSWEEANRRFDLGLEPWDGWEIPNPRKGQSEQSAEGSEQDTTRTSPRLH